MAGTLPIALNYQELYGDPTNNPLGTESEGIKVCLRAVFEVWRSSTDPLKIEELLSNVVADFSRPIGCVVAFVADQDPPSGSLRLLHSFQSFLGVPGQSRDRMQVFFTEGDVEGVDMADVVFDANQLGITADIVVPGSAERMFQLLNNEPGHGLVGPYDSTDANVRTTKAQSMAYLPYHLVGGLFGSNLTARQAY
jgi:hypothetical protein